MEKDIIFNQMAQYDFSTPMNITTIFEEDSNDDISNPNLLNEQVQNNNNESTQDVVQVQEYTREPQDPAKIKSCKRSLNENILGQSKVNKQNQEQSSNTKENTQVYSLASTVEVANINTHATEMAGDPEISDNIELSSCVKNLLDTVSEHLLVIMRHFYNYYYNNKNNGTDVEFLKRFNDVKHYFYNLSYTTVITIILPQQKNEKFINKLIDKTVFDANKVFNWKCERKHVEPFLLQMIAWSKKKKEAMKTLGSSRPINDVLLRRYLTETTQQINNPTNSPQATYPINGAINNNYEVVSNTDRNMCIFTSGPPGKEINIHISPTTLLSHCEKQQSAKTQEPRKKKRNRLNSLHDTEQTPTQVHNVVSVDYTQQNCCPPNITIHHRPIPTQPPPPYHCNNSSPNVLTNNSYNINQMNQNFSRTIQNIQTQATYVPREQQYCTPSEGQTFSPIITNVTTWNPAALPTIGRCCICGKSTISRCSKCNKFSYCSALCQELDSGTHKAICS